MDIAAEIAAAMGDDWLPNIYRGKVRTQRTRSIILEIPARLNNADIQYTLLGIELKVGKNRFACPDLAAARYMRVFARFGCASFAIPYDISRISTIADELETSWQRSLLQLGSIGPARTTKGLAQLRANLGKSMRTEIESIGAGEAMPAFDRETRQRGQ